MKNHKTSRRINRLTHGRIKFGWWSSDYVSSQSPVILVGCSRSGTTLLRQILSAHSRLYIGPETAILLGNRKFDHLQRVTELPVRTLRHHYRGSPCLARFFEKVMIDLMHRHGKQQWGEKTPDNVLRIEAILRQFPQARVIHIVRDGRDVACSLRTHPKYKWRDGEYRKTGQVNPWEECVTKWVKHTRLGLAWRHDARCKLVRYEDLITRTQQTAEELFDWLGLPMESRVLNEFQTDRFANHPLLNGPISQQAHGRWQTDLPVEAHALFKGDAGDLLIELDYADSHQWIQSAPNAEAA